MNAINSHLSGRQRRWQPLRAAMRLGLRLALPLLALASLSACSRLPSLGRTPVLKAIRVGSVPKPNAMIETALWERVPPTVVRVRRHTSAHADTQVVQLRAITDGRVLSVMVRWYDTTETINKRTWVWNDRDGDYQLEKYQADMFAFQWPLSDDAPFNMLDGREAAYDVWRWQAAWNNLSGYADDLSLRLTPHPLGTKPPEGGGRLYRNNEGTGLVEMVWQADDGAPGVVNAKKPTSKIRPRMPGGRQIQPLGSAADVRAVGLYNPTKNRAKAHYFVEFYRTLTTADDENDYQIVGPGPHPFAIALADQTGGADHYTSGKILLYVE